MPASTSSSAGQAEAEFATFEKLKVAGWSLLIFVAWLVAASGWVRALAPIWLLYPGFLAWRAARRRAGRGFD